MTHADGFSGIADITWAGDYPKKINVKSSVGTLYGGILGNCKKHVRWVICLAADVNVRHCCIGHTTVENCKTTI